MAAPRTEPGRARLAAGAIVFAVAVALFAAIAFEVVQGRRLTALDDDVAAWLHRQATPALTTWITAVTDLHSTFAVSCYAAVVVLHQAWRRRWRRAAMWIIGIGGVLALNVALKFAFARARPAFDDPLLTLSTYSFPSGHVAGTTVFYGLVVAWLFGRMAAPGRRALAVLAALAAVALVALSRLYLGVHYLSDVGAAFAEGVGWLAICQTTLALCWRENAGTHITLATSPTSPPA